MDSGRATSDKATSNDYALTAFLAVSHTWLSSVVLNKDSTDCRVTDTTVCGLADD